MKNPKKNLVKNNEKTHTDNEVKRYLGILQEQHLDEFKIVKEGMDGINQRLDVMQSDVDDLKKDMTIVKIDVSELKSDVAVLKTDVSILKSDVAVLKTDVSILKSDVSILKTDVSEIKDDLKQKVNRPEFEILGRRMSVVEKKVFH